MSKKIKIKIVIDGEYVRVKAGRVTVAHMMQAHNALGKAIAETINQMDEEYEQEIMNDLSAN